MNNLPEPPLPLPAPTNRIHSWSLHFGGVTDLSGDAPVFRHFLKLNASYTEWYPEEPGSSPNEPVLTILDGGAEVLSLITQPATDAVVGEAPWVLFNQGGLLAEVDLKPEGFSAGSNTRLIGSTENISVRATLRNERGDDFSGKLETPLRACRAVLRQTLPYEDLTSLPEDVDLTAFANIRPVLYLEQGYGGFVLLAELVDEFGYRRVLFSIRTRSEPDSSGEVSEKQHWAVSRPYLVIAIPEYTIRVHQDGDISRPAVDQTTGMSYRYFEFWVNNLPLGVYGLSSTTFPFKTAATRVGIGCWPRAEGNIYFKGGIGEIIFDPHDTCPGC